MALISSSSSTLARYFSTAPGGAFGVGILEVTDEAEARQFGQNDPSVRAAMNRFEIYPMRVADARAKKRDG